MLLITNSIRGWLIASLYLFLISTASISLLKFFNASSFSPVRLADKLGMGKKNVESYNLELYSAGLLRYIPKGIELTPNELLLDNNIAKQRKEWNPTNSKNVVKIAFKSK